MGIVENRLLQLLHGKCRWHERWDTLPSPSPDEGARESIEREHKVVQWPEGAEEAKVSEGTREPGLLDR